MSILIRVGIVYNSIMTVTNPSVEACPECGSEEMYGDRRVHVNIGLDGEGGIFSMETSDSSIALESLRCSECDHSLIEDGTIVDSAVTGSEF